MKTVASLVLVVFVAGLAPAQDGQQKANPATPESKPAAAKDRRMGRATPIVMAGEKEVYGAELTLKETTKLEDVLKDPKAFEGRKIRVSGVIENVCQKKGCWMNVKDGGARAQVKFVDYSFFVPLDVAGRTVAVEGIAKETVITEAMRRHYAEDAGKSRDEIEKIKGDEKAVMLVVEAVEIAGAAKAEPKEAESRPAGKKP